MQNNARYADGGRKKNKTIKRLSYVIFRLVAVIEVNIFFPRDIYLFFTV